VLPSAAGEKLPSSPQDAEIAAISIARTKQFPRRDDISAICPLGKPNDFDRRHIREDPLQPLTDTTWRRDEIS
jgi:hypothetical protein